MIALVGTGADSNPAGASQFVGIPVPVNTANGDIALVAIALPAANITVTPPDSSWIQIRATDPTQSLSIVAFWSLVLNPPVNWVFALSASTQAAGSAVVYRGADGLSPIDAQAAALTASSATHTVPGITATLPLEKIVLMLAAGTSGTYTPAGSYQLAVRKQQANATIEIQDQQLPQAGVQAATSETFSSATAGAVLAVALAPSQGTVSFADAYQRVFDALPPGIDNVLDFTVGVGDYYKYFWTYGAILKLFVFDLYDILRTEVLAHLSRYKLPDWEGIFGLSGSLVSQTGTIPQRQAQVLGSWRAAAGQGSSIAAVQAVLAPLLGYNPSTVPQVIEADVPALRLEHAYGFSGDLIVAAGNTGTVNIFVTDGGKIAKMGAQLEIALSRNDVLSQLSFTLTAPDGTAVTWNGATVTVPWTTSPLKLYGPSFAGSKLLGSWTLSMTNSSGFAVTLYDGDVLFVEGMAQGQQTGGAIFSWGVYADPAHVGENGNPANYPAARSAIQRLAQSHTLGTLIQSLAPYPDTTTGAHAAIPDECVPV